MSPSDGYHLLNHIHNYYYDYYYFPYVRSGYIIIIVRFMMFQ